MSVVGQHGVDLEVGHEAGIHAHELKLVEPRVVADCGECGFHLMQPEHVVRHGAREGEGAVGACPGRWIAPAARPAHAVVRENQRVFVGGVVLHAPLDEIDEAARIGHVDFAHILYNRRVDLVEVIILGNQITTGAGDIAVACVTALEAVKLGNDFDIVTGADAFRLVEVGEDVLLEHLIVGIAVEQDCPSVAAGGGGAACGPHCCRARGGTYIDDGRARCGHHFGDRLAECTCSAEDGRQLSQAAARCGGNGGRVGLLIRQDGAASATKDGAPHDPEQQANAQQNANWARLLVGKEAQNDGQQSADGRAAARAARRAAGATRLAAAAVTTRCAGCLAVAWIGGGLAATCDAHGGLFRVIVGCEERPAGSELWFVGSLQIGGRAGQCRLQGMGWAEEVVERLHEGGLLWHDDSLLCGAGLLVHVGACPAGRTRFCLSDADIIRQNQAI